MEVSYALKMQAALSLITQMCLLPVSDTYMRSWVGSQYTCNKVCNTMQYPRKSDHTGLAIGVQGYRDIYMYKDMTYVYIYIYIYKDMTSLQSPCGASI